MEQPLNKFDQSIKDSFDGFEVPYSDAAWKSVQQELRVVSPGSLNYFGSITTGIVATGLVFMAMLYLVSDTIPGTDATEQVELIDEENPNLGTGNAGSTYTSAEADDEGATDSKSTILENLENPIATSDTEKGSGDAVIPNSVDDKNVTRTGKTQSASNAPKKALTASSNTTNNIQKGCTGLTIDFESSGAYGNTARYLWNFGDGFFSNEPNPSHTFNKEGIFDVSLSVTSPATGQITSNVVQGMIEVVEAPVAQTSIDIKNPNGIVFSNQSFNAHETQWVVDGNLSGSTPSLYIDLRSDAPSQVDLVVYNTGGCSDTLKQSVQVIDHSEFFPTALSQSDNQVFAASSKPDGSISSFKIFDARGTLAFEGDPTKGWNGMKASGALAAKGNYYWVMIAEKQNEVKVYTGQFGVR